MQVLNSVRCFQQVWAVVIMKANLVAIVEQVASFACLANNQVLDLETVEPYDDRFWPLVWSRFWSKGSMGSVQLRERAKHLRAKDIQEHLREESGWTSAFYVLR